MSQIIQRTFGAGTDGVSPTDFIINLDATLGAVAVILPSTAVYRETNERIGGQNNARGFNYRFTQVGANVTTILVGDPMDTINGVASIVIPTGATGTISLTSDNKWSLNVSSTGSSPVDQDVWNLVSFIGQINGDVKPLYMPVNGTASGQFAFDTEARNNWQYRGAKTLTVKSFSIKTGRNWNTSDPITFTIIKNGVPTTLIVIIPGVVPNPTVFPIIPNVTDSFTIQTGDTISCEADIDRQSGGGVFSATTATLIVE